MVTGIYQEVELSLTENLIPVTVPVKQYDNKARKVRCVLYNNSVEYTLASGKLDAVHSRNLLDPSRYGLT